MLLKICVFSWPFKIIDKQTIKSEIWYGVGMWGLIEGEVWSFEWSRVSEDGLGVLREIVSSSSLYTAESLGWSVVVPS